jgi:tRNA(Ile)-lysidine synthase
MVGSIEMLTLNLPNDKYVVAVSGGIDSMVLLDLLRQRQTKNITVAHFNHGIRPDAASDREFVGAMAQQLNLPFVYENGALGPYASEANARQARYAFLERVRKATGAAYILLGHHQDDVIETAILNLIRGTGRRGLSALHDHDRLKRPLLAVPKKAIRDYATEHRIEWREDSTNADIRYKRNYVRHKVLPLLKTAERHRLITLITDNRAMNDQLETELANVLHMQPSTYELDRQWFSQLPYAVAIEVMAAWLRARGIRSYNSVTLTRLVIASKTKRTGALIDIIERKQLAIQKNVLALRLIER